MRSTSLDICRMRSEIPQPCCASGDRALRMSRSSVPCGRSMRSPPIGLPPFASTGRIVLPLLEERNGNLFLLATNRGLPQAGKLQRQHASDNAILDRVGELEPLAG